MESIGRGALDTRFRGYDEQHKFKWWARFAWP